MKWTVGRIEPRSRFECEVAPIVDENNRVMAYALEWRHQPPYKDTAALLAAAPELCAVLVQVQMLLETAEAVHPSVNGPGPARVVIEEKFWRYWLAEIRKVVAKAEGRHE
jgi:hypothetical protein